MSYDVNDKSCLLVIDDDATGTHVFRSRIPGMNTLLARGAALARMKKEPDGPDNIVLEMLDELTETPLLYKGKPLGEAPDWKDILKAKLPDMLENLDFLLFQSVVARPGSGFDLDSDHHEIKVTDGLTGEVHTFLYAMPTAAMRAEYKANLLVRKGEKVVSNIYPTRNKFAARIVKGFKPGTIVSGKVEMQGDEKDARRVLKARPDIAMAISFAVFESATKNTRTSGPDIPVVWEEEAAPLADS